MVAALEEAQRVLNENGRLFVIEPEPVGSWQEVSHPFHDEDRGSGKSRPGSRRVDEGRALSKDVDSIISAKISTITLMVSLSR